MTELRSHDRDQLASMIPVIAKLLNEETMLRWFVVGEKIKADLPAPLVMSVSLGPLHTVHFQGFHISLGIMDYTYDRERGHFTSVRYLEKLVPEVKFVMGKFMPDLPTFKQLSMFD